MRTALCSALLLVSLLTGAPASAPPPLGLPSQSADQLASAARVMTPALLLDHVKALAADNKEGRAPGTVGEERTVAYLVAQFKRLGLAPGNPDGSYVQAVPLIGFTGQATAAFEVKGTPMPLGVPDDVVVVSRQGLPEVHVSKAPMVFVGYGVVAPEFEWDDFKASMSAARPSSCSPAIRRCRTRRTRRRSIRRSSRAPRSRTTAAGLTSTKSPRRRAPLRPSSCTKPVRRATPSMSSRPAGGGRTSGSRDRTRRRGTRPSTPGSRWTARKCCSRPAARTSTRRRHARPRAGSGRLRSERRRASR